MKSTTSNSTTTEQKTWKPDFLAIGVTALTCILTSLALFIGLAGIVISEEMYVDIEVKKRNPHWDSFALYTATWIAIITWMLLTCACSFFLTWRKRPKMALVALFVGFAAVYVPDLFLWFSH